MAAAVALAACNTSGCYDNGSSIPLAGFYSGTTGYAISVDSITIIGVDAPADSAILRAGASGASQVYLPMRASASEVTWMIRYEQAALAEHDVADYIGFDYEAIPYFASEECGAMYAYRIRGVYHTDMLIDSVTLTDSLITNIDAETIRIYFRTAQAGEGDAQ